MDGPTGTPCERDEPAAIPHYNTDPKAGRPYQTTGDITPADVTPLDAPKAAALIALNGDGDAKAAEKVKLPNEPEKVSILDTAIAKTHTTFYGQKK